MLVAYYHYHQVFQGENSLHVINDCQELLQLNLPYSGDMGPRSIRKTNVVTLKHSEHSTVVVIRMTNDELLHVCVHACVYVYAPEAINY